MTDGINNIKQVQVEDLQENFEQIFEGVLVSGGPIEILKDTGNAILISEEVWRGITETLNLLFIPGMRETVRSGMREPIAGTATELDW
jgi:PHD/YefM family antitoxin component YafN of YafNO toxin-antitoxin module